MSKVRDVEPPAELVFGTVREALDNTVPADVAPVGAYVPHENLPEGSIVAPGGADIDMAIFKGIVAGALAGVSAKSVAHLMSDCMTAEVLNTDWEPAGWSTDLDLYESLPDAVAACYRGHIPPTNKMEIDLSTDTFGFKVQVEIWKWPSADFEHLISVYLESEGGPPTSFYFVRNDD